MPLKFALEALEGKFFRLLLPMKRDGKKETFTDLESYLRELTEGDSFGVLPIRVRLFNLK